MNELLYKEEIYQLVGFCLEIHRELGKGHDEIIYKDAIVVELSRAEFLSRARKVMRSATKESSCLTFIMRTSLSGIKFSLRPKRSRA